MKTNRFIMRLALAFSLLTITPLVYAWDQSGINIRIILSLVDFKPDPSRPRTPIEEPQVGQTDYTLYFLDGRDLGIHNSRIFCHDRSTTSQHTLRHLYH